MKVLVILFTGLFFGLSVYSGETLISLSIDEAKELAINNNKQLRSVRAGADIADHQFWEAISQGLPQVSASLDYIDYFNYEVEFGVMGGGPDDLDLGHLDPEHQQIILTIMSMFAGPSTIRMDNQATAQIQVSQLIFSGQYIAGIQIARIAKMLAEKNIDKTELSVRHSVEAAYHTVLITEQTVEILEKNLENLRETKKQTEALLGVGMIEPIDVDQIEMSIIMLENNIRSMERNVQLSYNVLRIQLGLDNDTDIILTEKLDDIIENVDVEALVLKDFVYQNNIDYRMLETQEEVAKKMIDMERWAYAPSLVTAYSYNEKIRTTDFDMNPNHLLTFRLSVPIFSSGMRKSRVEQKRIELYQVQNSKSLLKDQLSMQERQLRYDLINAKEQYESQKKNVELAKRIYDHTEKKFRHGVSSSLDLTQANSNYLQAETNYITVLMELLQAKTSFNKLLENI